VACGRTKRNDGDMVARANGKHSRGDAVRDGVRKSFARARHGCAGRAFLGARGRAPAARALTLKVVGAGGAPHGVFGALAYYSTAIVGEADARRPASDQIGLMRNTSAPPPMRGGIEAISGGREPLARAIRAEDRARRGPKRTMGKGGAAGTTKGGEIRTDRQLAPALGPRGSTLPRGFER